MKKIFIALIVLLVTHTLVAQEQPLSEIKTEKFQKQIIDAQNLIREVGREKIADVYFQRLRESQVELAQVKANPNNIKASLNAVNELYHEIENILNPDNVNLDTPISKLLKSKNRGGNSGVIRGLIRDLNGEILTSGHVRLYNQSGTIFRTSQIDASGRYIFTNLTEDQYAIIFVSYYSDVVDTAYPSKPCPNGLGYGCQLSDLNLISLEDGQNLEGINLTVLNMPTISGQLLDENDAYVRSARVYAYDTNGDRLSGSGYTDYQGKYTIAIPEAGQVYLTFSHSEYQLELYNDILCVQECVLSSGTPITVNYNQDIENINAHLESNATISGIMIEAGSSLPVLNSYVYVLDENGSIVSQQNFNSTHLWGSNVRAGNYYIIGSDRYSSDDYYLATVYPNNNPCLTNTNSYCILENGAWLSHSTRDLNNIELIRRTGARIDGTMFDIDNQLLPDRSVTFSIYHSLNTSQPIYNYNSLTDESGHYSTRQLGNGDFYIVVSVDSHIPQLYSNVDCVNNSCDLDSGTLISINDSTDVHNINFQLTPKSKISGTVVDHNNNPLSNLNIVLREQTNYQSYYAYTDSNGEYEINNILPGSDYKLSVRGEGGYYSEVYENIQCTSYYCDNEDNYTPIVLDYNQQLIIDFELDKKGQVSFDLNSNSINPVSNGRIYAVDLKGNVVSSIYPNSSGFLPKGSYYFYYSSSGSSNFTFADKVYGGTNCELDCDATTGTLVYISDNSEQNFTMNLDQRFYLEVTSSVNYSRINIYEEDLSYYSGVSIYGTRIISLNNLSNYYLKVSEPGYFSQVYNGINCEDSACDLTQGNLIEPVLNSSLSINFDLEPQASISGVITDENNVPLANKRVIVSTDINSTSYILTNEAGEYSYNVLTPGDYYLKVNSSDNYQDFDKYITTYYGNIPCDLTDCSELGVQPIAINVSDYLTGYDIQMTERGTISGEGITNVLDETIVVDLDFYRVEGESLVKKLDVRIENGILNPLYLPAGEYKLVAQKYYQNLYTAYPSNVCDLNSSQQCAEIADSLFVTQGNNTHFSSFVLSQYGVINVEFLDANDNSPIFDTRVRLYKSNGEIEGTHYSGNSDNHVSFSLVNDNQYKAFLFDSDDKYIAQIYNGVDCADGIGFDCLFSQGQDFSVGFDSVYSIVAYLKPKPRLKIDVINEITNKQIPNSRMKIFDSFGNKVWDEYSPNLEESHYVENLGPGEYYAMAYLNSSYSITAYPNVVCENFEDLDSCGEGITSFSLQPGDNPKQININTTLVKGINGYVVDAISRQPLENVIIDFWSSEGYNRGSAVSSANGGFSKSTSSGDYFLSTDTNSDYINEVYNDIQCERAAIIGECDVTRGQLMSVQEKNLAPIMINIELAKDPVFTNGFD